MSSLPGARALANSFQRVASLPSLGEEALTAAAANAPAAPPAPAPIPAALAVAPPAAVAAATFPPRVATYTRGGRVQRFTMVNIVAAIWTLILLRETSLRVYPFHFFFINYLIFKIIIVLQLSICGCILRVGINLYLFQRLQTILLL
ncbi:hypothetical protein BO82DRAFT_370267 [Aspergillus uvarum CBS 121591]|uniref:Uncharacterized protein n=1 Tax=Aspergillus uvarum CBS 121591 TaxID=1448315 RepID=A0A319BSD6_9EURO|nr:hypothetical protein BO82DRAFT_370267 [Aspergillus uvarum CBS 121591]PYH75371.1 hypothetical protein BO82DRAFT_370267 [Aspergillus uvarum CBS 121591]